MSSKVHFIHATKLTGNLPAAVGVISVSGPGAVDAVLSCWKSVSGKSELRLNHIYYGQWIGPRNKLHQNSEDVVLCRVKTDTIEIHCHGGPAVLNRVLDDLATNPGVQLDASHLLGGKDQIVSDAWQDLQAARTVNAVHLLLTQANGKLSRTIELLATDADAPAEQKRSQCEELVRRSRIGIQISQPPEVAILGPPNVGKSTLINRLLGWERAIVDATPGTTRDVLREEISLAGWPFTILDTAGLRQSSDDIEKEGISKALKLAQRVACILLVIDGTVGWTEKQREIYDQFVETTILVLSKSDLVGKERVAGKDNYPADAFPISALTGEGIESLITGVIKKLGYDASLLDEAVPFRQSQVDTIQAASRLVHDHAAFAKLLNGLLNKD